MKNLLFLSLFVLTLLTSCGGVSGPKYSVITGSVDYSQYTKSGFFITEANSVSFSYNPIGSVTAVVTSGNDGGKFVEANYEDALYYLHSKAKEIGGNGIINLKFEFIPSRNLQYGVVTMSQVVATGMAIRRKANK